VADRGELEAPLTGSELDVDAVSDSKLRRKITRLTNGSPLKPLFETVVERAARQLHTTTGDFEPRARRRCRARGQSGGHAALPCTLTLEKIRLRSRSYNRRILKRAIAIFNQFNLSREDFYWLAACNAYPHRGLR
jgi:hypothetical protein